MSDTNDAASVAADTSAPEPAVTVAADPPETQTPETPAEEAPPKTFTQEEMDAAIAKRLAREQRKWERDQAAKAEAPKGPASAEIDPDYDFEGHIEAKANERAEEIAREREAKRERQQTVEAYQERVEKTQERYDDFEQVAYSPNVDVTPVMFETLMQSDLGPEILYYLGSNTAEASKISRLNPFLQAKEIGRIEAKLAIEPPPARKTSSAPPPISPLAPNGTKQAFDTTDPRAAATMDTGAWIAAEEARMRRKARGS